MTIRINKKEAIRLLEQEVAEKGAGHKASATNWVLDEKYRNTNVPNCIIGHIYHRLGITPKDTEGSGYITDAVPDIEAARPGEFEFTPDAITVLRVAQRTQDLGGTWGEALAAAKAARVG